MHRNTSYINIVHHDTCAIISAGLIFLVSYTQKFPTWSKCKYLCKLIPICSLMKIEKSFRCLVFMALTVDDCMSQDRADHQHTTVIKRICLYFQTPCWLMSREQGNKIGYLRIYNTRRWIIAFSFHRSGNHQQMTWKSSVKKCAIHHDIVRIIDKFHRYRTHSFRGRKVEDYYFPGVLSEKWLSRNKNRHRSHFNRKHNFCYRFYYI